jgi:phospholipid-binding lipoprotein MlaA
MKRARFLFPRPPQHRALRVSLSLLLLPLALEGPLPAATIFFYPPAENGTPKTQPEADQTAASLENGAAPSSDPVERVNRGIFAFNHQLYRFVLRPLGRVTETLLTKPVLKALDRAFENVDAPVRVVGSLMQGKPQRALLETEKLLVNTTLGVGGLFKASDRFERYRSIPKEDVGQAFGHWGIPSGPYLVLPVLGPSSSRDLVGKAADIALNPITWLPHTTLRNSIAGGRALEQNPAQMRAYDQTIEGAVDRYIAVREGYLSYRAEAVRR